MNRSKSFLVFAACSIASLGTAVAEAKPYKGAEVYQLEPFLYGRIAMRMRMARGSGVLSTFFLYKNGSEVTGEFWEEVDIEVMGKNDSHGWQSNIITGLNKQMSEEAYDTGASLADAYHTYVLEWAPTYVAWYFDGKEIRRTEGGQAAELTNPETIRFNLWISAIPEWAGEFDDASLPTYQFVNWVKYYRYEAGQFVLDWSDDFDSFDEDRWGKGDWTWAENRSDHAPANAMVKNGTLVLALTKEGQTGFTGEVPVDPGEPDGGFGTSDGGSTDSATDATSDSADARSDGGKSGRTGSASGSSGKPRTTSGVMGSASGKSGAAPSTTSGKTSGASGKAPSGADRDDEDDAHEDSPSGGGGCSLDGAVMKGHFTWSLVLLSGLALLRRRLTGRRSARRDR